MPRFPKRSPQRLTLGPLELEIMTILWTQGKATAKVIHDHILADPDRELAYASVMTVLQRLAAKGWVASEKVGRSFRWHPLLSQEDSHTLQAYDHLQKFLAVGNPDIVAAFADELDQASVEKLQAIAQRLKSARQQQED